MDAMPSVPMDVLSAQGSSLLKRDARPPRPGGGGRGVRRRYTWAELLLWVSMVDVLQCPHCGGTRRLLAAIHDPETIDLAKERPGVVKRLEVMNDEGARGVNLC